MKIITDIKEMKNEIREIKSQGKTIGFVPTMGYLHEGHASLARRARKENQVVIMSIFVNPTQFGPNEDFAAYPRDMQRDSVVAEKAGVDIIFNPSAEDIYPKGYKTYVNVEEITKYLCGISRPIHFRGVTTIVNKLFNIVMPDRAYFGQKDFQQLCVIKQMVYDLNMNLEIIGCPIIRQSDNLAMSSRNIYLSEEDRRTATVLSEALFKAKGMIENGESDANKIQEFIINLITSKPNTQIDYVEIVNTNPGDNLLKSINSIKGNITILLAVKVGKVRLIDNIALEV
jgi:pantoate--beta-alanine ligase